MNLSNRIIALSERRPPDLQIGGAENPYLNRWYVIPRNRFFNIYLHQFIRDDDDRAKHDHPWASISLMLRGILFEYIQGREGYRIIRRGNWTYRGPWFAHRLEVFIIDRGNTWTLFITGPKIRHWGFHCPNGWVHWEIFTAGAKGEVVGKGCGEIMTIREHIARLWRIWRRPAREAYQFFTADMLWHLRDGRHWDANMKRLDVFRWNVVESPEATQKFSMAYIRGLNTISILGMAKAQKPAAKLEMIP